MIFYYDGQWRSDPQCLSVYDRGFALADNVFTTLRAERGEPLYFQDHYERLVHAASVFMMPMPAGLAQMRAQVGELLIRNRLEKTTAAVRITVTRETPPGQRGIDFDAGCRGVLLITAHAYTPPTDPVRLMISDIVRPKNHPLSGIKYGDYASHIIARRRAVLAGYDDAILVNEDGNLVCTTAANIYFGKKSLIFTPPLSDGCLSGITRKYMLNNTSVLVERSMSKFDINNIDFAFISNSLHGLRRVACIGGTELPLRALSDPEQSLYM